MNLKEDVYTSVLPLFYVTKLLGLSCFSSSSTSCRNRKTDRPTFHVSRLGPLYNLLVIVVILALLWVTWTIAGDLLVKYSRSKIGIALDIFSLVGPIGLNTVYLIAAHRQRRVVSCFQQMSDVDAKIERLGLQIPHAKNRRLLVFGLIGGLLLNVVVISFDAALSILDDNEAFFFPMTSWFGFHLPRIVNHIAEYQLVMWLLALRQRFQIVNTRLLNSDDMSGNIITVSSITQIENDEPAAQGARKSDTDHCSDVTSVRRLAELHTLLCDLTVDVNHIFSFQLLVSVTCYFIDIAMTIYYGILDIVVSESGSNHMVFYIFYWLAWYSGKIIIICACCGMLSREAKGSGELVHKTMMATTDPIMKNELLFFSNQLLHRDVNISAGNFFVVDLNLIYSMVGAVTTYLIILIQFELSARQNTTQAPVSDTMTSSSPAVTSGGQ